MCTIYIRYIHIHVHVPHHFLHNNILCAAKLTEGHLALQHFCLEYLSYHLANICILVQFDSSSIPTPLFAHLHLFEVQGTIVHFNQLFQHLSSVIHGGHHDQCASITTHKEGI